MPPDLRTYCLAVTGAMSTSRQTEVFGPESDPATEVKTPTSVKAGEELDPVVLRFVCADTVVL